MSPSQEVPAEAPPEPQAEAKSPQEAEKGRPHRKCCLKARVLINLVIGALLTMVVVLSLLFCVVLPHLHAHAAKPAAGVKLHGQVQEGGGDLRPRPLLGDRPRYRPRRAHQGRQRRGRVHRLHVLPGHHEPPEQWHWRRLYYDPLQPDDQVVHCDRRP
uniref:Uncharacterized protein n=1 Tax=Steinernema glaseri TaxID=37863 RepID=A0A1I7Z397_9BILA